MKHGYVERWNNNLAFTVDKVGEDADGNHLVEVTVHDRGNTEEMSVRMTVSKEYYGSMIPWIAVRVVIADLAASSYERVRRLEAGRMEPQVQLENKAQYLAALESVPGLSQKALELPEAALRAHMMMLKEFKGSTVDSGISASVSTHNAHKLIFDRGLPDVLDFQVDENGERVVLARWNGRGNYFHEHRFLGFDWTGFVGKPALEDFLGMLNLHIPFQFEDIRPRRIHRRKGPKEWAPDDYHSFTLLKGRDYGRSLE